ncbi:ATP-dependent DNA helicase RecQ [uncultured Tenacibaculum sp.]|uniref:RecQ family ATP-dependent DNA helicase n=1 Tax=uncultured Tenacibaculum sp. TaxID=174713 RepID=UPI002606324C|nr:ATP-dependent DNA helicase RecQ [uncultured Tenacibaculum sp.]
MFDKALQIVQHYWGYDTFRPVQEQIIKTVLDKKDTIALLPTGGGKSLCFQIPALCFEGVCLVVSPLIALMDDQVQNLTNKGIKACTISSGSTQNEIITLFDNIRFGNYKFLYISPERLQSKFIQEKIKQLNVSLIAIDEAHCISEWGHDFRPSYRNIYSLNSIHPDTPIIALTATATQKVISDISSVLNIENISIFKQSFYRENLAYQVFFTEDKLYRLTQICTKTKAPVIVYVNSRKRTKDISNYLNAKGFKSSYYHGGLSSIEKKTAFDKWYTEETPIMVATNAFGMGIDKSNVKAVVHLYLPSSIENYIQEAGRGGRNGAKAFSVVLTNKSDIELTKELQTKALPTIDDVKLVHQKLYQHFQIAKGELIETSFNLNVLDFCNKYGFPINKVYSILQILINNGIIQLENGYNQKSTIQFLTSPYSLKNNKTVQTILRLYGGVFDQETKIDEFLIAKKINQTSWSVIEELERLVQSETIIYNKANTDSKLYFLVPREDDATINRISKDLKTFLKQKRQKTEDLLYFIQNNTVCRSQQLLFYFDENSTKKCGKCDVCLHEKTNTIKEENIIILLKEHEELSSREICELLNTKEENILILLRLLLSEEKVTLNSLNKYTLL